MSTLDVADVMKVGVAVVPDSLRTAMSPFEAGVTGPAEIT
jgi:hypothetical protein